MGRPSASGRGPGASRRVLITGAGGGIGRALAGAFAHGGWEVVLTDVDESALEAARDALAADGAACHAFPLDVTDPESIFAARAAVHERVGRIGALVNNAGTVHGGPFLDVPLELHRRVYRINVEGTVAVTHAFLPEILDAREGCLVFIASASGFIGLPNGSTYASSKWATIGFAESIRAELRHQGHCHVHVTTVCPSYVDTGLFAGVSPPRSTKLLDPAELAAEILEAVVKKKVWLLTPATVKLTPLLRSLLPTRISDRVATALGVDRSMDHWAGHPRVEPGREG
ncbi:MAG: SDR family NAD(P)-dependent oxidoreductase [Acidobacteriota bacterium]|nr:SDR family NAD(P)-dependent oxidoreductase [Acidobacteriota bacterium]